MPEIYDSLNLKQNEIKEAVFEQTTFPSGSKVGRVIYHTTLKDVYVCMDGTGDTTLSSKWKLLSEGSEKVDFTYASTSPISLKNLLVGQRLLLVELIVDTAFNDVASTCSLGISGNQEKYMLKNQNLLTDTAEFVVSPNYLVPSGSELVQFFFDFKTSTTGSGRIKIYYD